MTRYALYVLPAPGSTLDDFGRSVLGIRSATGASISYPPGLDDLASVTSQACFYGFHATLKAPMRLMAGISEDQVIGEVERLAAAHAPVAAGDLTVAALGPFLALVPRAPPPDLALLAAECVAALDPMRAPLSEAERARRRPEQLNARGRVLLDRWGYPYVFEAFRFHMTLTDAVRDKDRDGWHARLSRAYAASGPEPLTIDAVCVLRQDDPDDGSHGPRPFRLLARIPFGGHDGRSPGT